MLVECERGPGELRRSVLQVWSKDGDLLAEHDRIHADPTYPACFLRDRLPSDWLEIMGKGGDEPEASPALTHRSSMAINSEAKEIAHG